MHPVYTLPVWLTDEQLLRDEAVLFGLSETRPDEKIGSIRLAFSALTAPLEKQIEQHQEAIGNLNLLLENQENQPVHSSVRGANSVFGSWPVASFVVGLLAALAVCVGTYAGTLALATSQLALLVAGLSGLSSCVAILFICQAIYRKSLATNEFISRQRDDSRKQQLDERANWQQQKRTEIDQLYWAEASLNQQNAHRDLLIRLFESEFDLARSLRHQVRDRFVDM